MGWSVSNLDNTVKISKKCEKELRPILASLDVLWDDDDKFIHYGKLYFNPDYMEHIDFLWNDEILEVLKKHKVNGRITFGQLEGDGGVQFWGYEFNNGELTKLTGSVTYAASKE